MDMLRALLRPQRDIAIPSYDGDDRVDLLVKALFYMYRRVNLFVPFGEASDLRVEALSQDDQDNLDKMYNLQGFKDALFRNKHRVLVDWARNKFRSLLILAHTPQMDNPPQFPLSSFKFSVLAPDSSRDEYLRHLCESDIYLEHHLPQDVRRRIAASLLDKHPQQTLESWTKVIAEFVELLAVEVQVARLYRAGLGGASSPTLAGQGSPTLGPQLSPQLSPMLNSAQLSSSGAPNSPSGSQSTLGTPSTHTHHSPTLASPNPSPPASPRQATPKLHTKPSIGRIKGLKMAPDARTPRSQSPGREPSSPPKLRESPLKAPRLSPQREVHHQASHGSLRSPSHGSPHGSPQGSPCPSPTLSRRENGSRPASPLRRAPSTTPLRLKQDLVPDLVPRSMLLQQTRLAVEARLAREELLI